MTTRARIGLSRLEALVQSVPNISDVEKDNDSVTFKFRDKDKDNVAVLVNELDEERIVAVMPLPLPEGRIIASLVAANNWNQRKDAHGTFAYMTNVNGTAYILIESHLILCGGVEEENIKLWVKNLVNHINPCEEQIISTLKEIGEDTELAGRSAENSSNGSNPFMDAIIGEGSYHVAKTLWDVLLG